ncbi:MAG: hypothetical protein SPF89_12525 [Sphaerochaetaceae bacterium]|nr:hypothetical protein [Spirochaetales bacterium]MDY5500920.1 hypothetical protein [Sphaerochaetaceae bacterium]
MAHEQIYHTDTEEVKLPCGFSWMTFLLGPLYTGYLGDVPATILLVLLYIPMLVLVILSHATGIFGFWLLNIPFACLYNRRLAALYQAVGFSSGPLPPKKEEKTAITYAIGSPWNQIDDALDATPSDMWYTIKLYGISKPSNTRGISVGRGKVPSGYHTLCGFLSGRGAEPVTDELDVGATIMVKIDNKQVWSFTAKEKTRLAGKTFSIPVKEGDAITVSVKQGNSKLDNLRLVLV